MASSPSPETTVSPESSARAVCDEIKRLPHDWHGAGSFAPQVFDTMLKYASRRPIRHSLETGSGKSTLLFSHLSADHLVFARVRAYKSNVLVRAERRLAALRAIDEEAGGKTGLDLQAFAESVAALSELVSRHNMIVANFNASRVDLHEKESQAREVQARALAAVTVKFGRDSREYAQAGGKRTSDRERPRRQQPVADPRPEKEAAQDATPK